MPSLLIRCMLTCASAAQMLDGKTPLTGTKPPAHDSHYMKQPEGPPEEALKAHHRIAKVGPANQSSLRFQQGPQTIARLLNHLFKQSFSVQLHLRPICMNSLIGLLGGIGRQF